MRSPRTVTTSARSWVSQLLSCEFKNRNKINMHRYSSQGDGEKRSSWVHVHENGALQGNTVIGWVNEKTELCCNINVNLSLHSTIVTGY